MTVTASTCRAKLHPFLTNMISAAPLYLILFHPTIFFVLYDKMHWNKLRTSSTWVAVRHEQVAVGREHSRTTRCTATSKRSRVPARGLHVVFRPRSISKQGGALGRGEQSAGLQPLSTTFGPTRAVCDSDFCNVGPKGQCWHMLCAVSF